jgi:hypothetical protein
LRAGAVQGGVGLGGPDKGFGIVVGLAQKAVDGGLELGDALEDAAFAPTPGELLLASIH